MKKFFIIFISSLTICSSSINIFANSLDINKSNNYNISKCLEIINAKKNKIQQDNDIKIDENQKIYLNHKLINLPNTLIYENRLYLPVRSLTEILGIIVDYLPNEKIVIIDNGNIQLPIGQNKAVVKDKIVCIDEENEKIGSILVEGITYLPVRFICENLGYNVNYDNNKKEIKLIKSSDISESSNIITLDKSQAIEIYNNIRNETNNIKNATINSNISMESNLISGNESLNLNTNINSIIKFDKNEPLILTLNQKAVNELLGEKKTTEQIGFYKDGNFYLKQGDSKIKVKASINQILDSIQQISIKDIINDKVILGATLKNLDNGNKEYSFEIDFTKDLNILNKFTQNFNLNTNDLKNLEEINISNNKLVIIVNSYNQIINAMNEFNMQLSYEGVTMKSKIKTYTEYKEIDATKIVLPDEDISKYKDISKNS